MRSGIDIFAFGLIIFEIYNDGKSLWEMFDGIDRSDASAILKCAANLTDKQVTDKIKSTFDHDRMTALRSWLGYALKVNQKDR